MTKNAIVTITDSFSPANMPFNEFVLYKMKHKPQTRQFFIVLFEEKPIINMDCPYELPIYFCGRSIASLRRALKEIRRLCEREHLSIVFHIHEAKSVLFFTLAMGLQYRNRIVYTLHSTFTNYPLHNKLFSVLASMLSGRVVCVSETSYRHYPVLLKKLLKNRVLPIQNGVDCERIDAARGRQQPGDHRDGPGALRLIYVARLVAIKRHDILLKALKTLPDATLTLIGQGGLHDSLREAAKAYGVGDRVSFAGMLPRDEVFARILEHDVYVSSSLYEGLPISVLEAMSCDVVCAVSDIEQHREIQKKCPSLITVNNTPEDWAQALQSIAAMSKEERSRIGAQNKRDVDRCFSLERMHHQYDQLYAEMANCTQRS